ncbi:MAG TPA: ABC transporter permease [Clostridiaceae bacterium]|nr:ABC transporter permease [Clostridiaceae bacterium]
MNIFKTTLRIVRAHLAAFLVYLALPVFMTAMFVGFSPAQGLDAYQNSEVVFAVFDRDQSVVSQGLIACLENGNNRVDLPDDRDSIRDSLFYMQTAYVLDIPAGFGARLLDPAGEPPVLGRQTAPDTMAPSALDGRIRRFVTFVERFRDLEPDAAPGTIVDKALQAAGTTGTVILESPPDSAMQNLPQPFRFLAYTMLNLSLLIIAQTVLSFRQRQIQERNFVSATPPVTINRRLLFSVLFVCFAAFFFNVLPVALLTGRTMLQASGLLLLLNTFCFALVSVSLGFLASAMFRQDSNLSSALQTILPLIMCFFSGIFVPLQFIPESVRRIASFMPTYWYNHSIIAMEESVALSPELTRLFMRNGAIQLSFAAVFFAAYFVLEFDRQKRRKIVAAYHS